MTNTSLGTKKEIMSVEKSSEVLDESGTVPPSQVNLHSPSFDLLCLKLTIGIALEETC